LTSSVVTVDEVDITFFPATSTASQILPARSKHEKKVTNAMCLKQTKKQQVLNVNRRLIDEFPRELEERRYF